MLPLFPQHREFGNLLALLVSKVRPKENIVMFLQTKNAEINVIGKQDLSADRYHFNLDCRSANSLRQIPLHEISNSLASLANSYGYILKWRLNLVSLSQKSKVITISINQSIIGLFSNLDLLEDYPSLSLNGRNSFPIKVI